LRQRPIDEDAAESQAVREMMSTALATARRRSNQPYFGSISRAAFAVAKSEFARGLPCGACERLLKELYRLRICFFLGSSICSGTVGPVSIYDDGPRIVIWEMTRACALACKHCRAKAIPNRDARELTTCEAFDLVDEVAAYGRPIFILTGGDPFMRSDVFEIVSYAAQRELRVAVSPSGTARLTKSALERLAAAGCRRMSLSIDGPDAETHDAFRGVKGAFERILTAAAHAREAGIELQINTTIARHNQAKIRAVADLIPKLDASVWTAFFLVPTTEAEIADCLDAAGFEAAFAELFQIWKDAPFMVTTAEAPHFRRFVSQYVARLPFAERPSKVDHFRFPAIGDGKGLVFVSHTGDISPGCFLPIVAGNVREQKLIDVYRNDPTFERLRDPDRTNGKCGRCDFRQMCGGSRARAYGFSGDPFGSEPCCAYVAPAYLASLESVSA
jgi:radical SAM protein